MKPTHRILLPLLLILIAALNANAQEKKAGIFRQWEMGSSSKSSTCRRTSAIKAG